MEHLLFRAVEDEEEKKGLLKLFINFGDLVNFTRQTGQLAFSDE